MIRNEAEYQEASKRLGDELKRLDEHRARLKDAGLGDVEVKRVAQGICCYVQFALTERAAAKIFASRCSNSVGDANCCAFENTVERGLSFASSDSGANDNTIGAANAFRDAQHSNAV